MTYESSARSPDQQLAIQLAPNLALLATLSQTPNLTRAAERLGVPQPTVSRRLAAVAETVGTPLTEPAGRGVRLTRVGRVLAETAAEALATVEAGARQVREESQPASGRVVLGFLHLLGRSLVPDLLRRFRVTYPGVRFSLVQGSRRQILDQLIAGDLDLALVAPPPDDPALAGFPLAEQELWLSVPEAHPLASRSRVEAAELADEQLVTLEPGYGLRQIVDTLCAAAGFQPTIAFEGQESDTVRGLVAAGFGVALLPRFGAGPPAGVVEVPLAPPVTRTIGLTWPADARPTPAIRAFRDEVRAWAAEPLEIR